MKRRVVLDRSKLLGFRICDQAHVPIRSKVGKPVRKGTPAPLGSKVGKSGPSKPR